MNKELSAIVRYERAEQQGAQLSKRIGACLDRCPISQVLNGCTSAELPKYYDEATQRTKTHLWHAFREREPSSCGHGMVGLDEDGISEYLHPRNDGCRHCYRAWKLILQRKAIKREIGIAKRAIRTIGRTALKHEAGYVAPKPKAEKPPEKILPLASDDPRRQCHEPDCWDCRGTGWSMRGKICSTNDAFPF